jgi:hypothetical protein
MKKKSIGLGDSIEKIIEATGLNTLTQFTNKIMSKKDCGCKKRKDLLNKKFPYKK